MKLFVYVGMLVYVLFGRHLLVFLGCRVPTFSNLNLHLWLLTNHTWFSREWRRRRFVYPRDSFVCTCNWSGRKAELELFGRNKLNRLFPVAESFPSLQLPPTLDCVGFDHLLLVCVISPHAGNKHMVRCDEWPLSGISSVAEPLAA